MEVYKCGELVEFKKFIVYYIDLVILEKWCFYFKQGVEDWQSVFEVVGFKNVIIVKDLLSKEEDLEWSLEDVCYLVICYVFIEIQNVMGLYVYDFCIGEILESDIIWYYNVMNFFCNWFFI